MTRLANGTAFPELTMSSVGGGSLVLPEELAGSYGVILAYRGSWCSRCNAQLASFQQARAQLNETGIKLAAFSTDDEAHATEMADKHGLTFPIGFGVNVESMSTTLGSYVNEAHRSLESSNFLIRPDGAIELCVYSSGPIGRLTPEDVIDIVNRRKQR